MKHITPIILFSVGIVLFAAINLASAELVLSEPNQNVFVGVSDGSTASLSNADWLTNAVPIRYDHEMFIVYFCKTNGVNLRVPLDYSRFIIFQMHDSKGREVQPTAKGLYWGSDITNFPDMSSRRTQDRTAPTGGEPYTGSISNFPGGMSLPRPNDLFEMKESGIYQLTLTVHLMKQRMLATNDWTWDPVAIPPVSVKVEKP
jgi:hypothetical protein